MCYGLDTLDVIIIFAPGARLTNYLWAHYMCRSYVTNITSV